MMFHLFKQLITCTGLLELQLHNDFSGPGRAFSWVSVWMFVCVCVWTIIFEIDDIDLDIYHCH